MTSHILAKSFRVESPKYINRSIRRSPNPICIYSKGRGRWSFIYKKKSPMTEKKREKRWIFTNKRLLLLLLLKFLTSVLTDGLSLEFEWQQVSSVSPQVSRTLLSILAVLDNAEVWMVSTRPPTSKSSSPFNNSFVIVPKAPITIGIIVTFMFHIFFNFRARSRYLSFFSHSFSFILWSAGTAKSTILQILFFFFFVNYYKVWSSSRD